MANSGSGPSTPTGVCALRISRVKDATGVPDGGNSKGAFVMCGGLSTVKYDYEVMKGTDISEEDGCGNLVVVKKRQDRVKVSTFQITMAKDDDRIVEITGTGVALSTAGVIIGSAVQAAMACLPPTNFGCVLEWWTEQTDCDVPKAGAPYKRHMIPWALLTPKGYEFKNGASLPVYDGFGQVNPNIGYGPFNDWPSIVGVTNLVYARMDDTALPVCATPLDYVALPAHS